ncbi:hypothetical protein EVAR_85524_1 [Eumeta japonica]|uniref:Uncharacterized protein n=1 Tax=Eumeta variegata TaxID=151549 RepID=A0A4C1VBW9_EUMVA|nr:hypothetical protein EVAR_85524_1 [Eumeta japonica]
MDRVLMQRRIMQPLGCSPSMMELFNSEQQRLETFHKNCSDDGLVSLYIRRRYSREGYLLKSCSSTVNNTDLKLSVQTDLGMNRVLYDVHNVLRTRCSREGFLLRQKSSTVINIGLIIRIRTILTMRRVFINQRTMKP